MKAIKWKSLVITSILCLLPMVLGIALWDKLPFVMATHFDVNNVPDGFMPKWMAVVGLPVLMMLLQVFCCVISDINAHIKGENKKFEAVMKGIMPVITVVVYLATIAYNMERNVDIRLVAMLIVGTVFIVMGNYMPKLNYLNSGWKRIEGERAKKINRILGYSMVVMGIIFIVTVFLPAVFSVAALFLLIAYAILTLILVFNKR